MTKVIQANLNRAREAQDLMLQHAVELGADLCIISEPARAPVSQRYLYRIGKEDTPICPYCQDGEDSADHTI